MKKYIPPIEPKEIKERLVYWKQSQISTRFWEMIMGEALIEPPKPMKINLLK